MVVKHMAFASMGAVLFLVPGALTVAQGDPFEAQAPSDRLIESFTVDRQSGRTVELRWTFEPHRRNEDITCTVDLDGEDPVEESIEDCGRDRSLTHTYERDGRYTVVLVARSRAGGADRATLTVTVP